MLKPAIVLLIVLFGQFKSAKIYLVNISSKAINHFPLLKEVKDYKRKFPTSSFLVIKKENDGSRIKKSPKKDRQKYNLYTNFLSNFSSILLKTSLSDFSAFRLLWFGCCRLV